ncbi:hypothetical protein [Planobispora longispora]|uniref:Uncharacterized protein n=1 Tax=Planobispora longispora TaxID=28887 RepID=A0A8J3RTZ3_9ACTN|nr:hypothetical protein GCM10020093_011410 [Planobispora longispora]GIH79812.1 hypothetical protein Plo01_62410 [Planobispora longispora]
MITILAVMASLAALVLFVVLVWGIHADDRSREPHQGPRTEAEHLSRRLLIYARLRDPSEDSISGSEPDYDRWR